MRKLSNFETLAERLRSKRDFYGDVIQSLLKSGILDREMRILVVCGAHHDREVLLQHGFSNVTISNLDAQSPAERMAYDWSHHMAPFDWSYQDAERLTFADGEFDFVIEHNGLHHCFSPHRALCEMHRVAKKGLLAFEPHDNVLSRVGTRLGFGQEYEAAAVFGTDMKSGGVANTEIPNYVYRWTENEIRKLAKSYFPYGPHQFEFFYGIRLPWVALAARKSKAAFVATLAMAPFITLGQRLIPRACNNFAFCVMKPQFPDELLPWLKWEDGAPKLDKDWLKDRYAGAKSA